MKKKTYINENGSVNFDKFHMLTEAEQKGEMKNWDERTWFEYDRSRPSFSEEEVFGPVIDLINKNYTD